MTKAINSILIITRSLPFHGLGGMEAVAWDLAREFQRAQLKVTILTTSCSNLDARNVIESVEIVCLPVKAGRYSAAWWRQTLETYEAHYQGQYDVVFSVSSGGMSIARTFHGRYEAPVFVSQAHGTTWAEIASKVSLPNPVEWLKALYISNRLWRDRGYRHFDAIVAVGPRVFSDLSRWPSRSIIGDLPIYEISNGIDTDTFRFDANLRAKVRDAYNIPDDAPLLISVSRLHAQKGVQHALEGFARALTRNRQLRLLVVGSGPYEEALRAQVECLDLSKAVTFTGAVIRNNLSALYSAADILLFTTTRVEGLPLNVLEALACSLPVIVSNHIVLQGQPHQYGVNPLAYEQVANSILDLVKMNNHSQKTCLLNNHFWLSSTAGQYLDLFERLAEGRLGSEI
jgi:glycosyltransferase involved in cell wall biosynthesis